MSEVHDKHKLSTEKQNQRMNHISNVSPGKGRRLSRILRCDTLRTVLVALDDSLLSGPRGQLMHVPTLLKVLSRAGADGIVGFPGMVALHFRYLSQMGCVV